MLTATLLLSLAVVSWSPTVAATATTPCNSASNLVSACVSNSGSQVDVSGTTTHPSRPGTGPQSPNGPGTTPPSPPAPSVEECLRRCDMVYDVETFPEVTASDLVSFRPAAPSVVSEPAGIGVVGMPANIVAAAAEQRLAGPLLGYDVVVRFAPVAYVFDYGDGTSLRSTAGGATWQRLGQAAFTPTATSHVFSDAGTYAVRVTTHYAAWVDFGTGTWFAVRGTVSATTGGHDLRIVEVRTALVDRTCLEDPTGPGC